MSNQRSFEMAIAQRREKFMMLVPEHISDKESYLNRLAFECDMLLHKNPRLAGCDPKSIMLGAMEAARHRLYFSQGECSLIPFKQTAVFVLGAAGVIKILYRTGLFKKIKYGAVFENDRFEFSEGTGDNDFIRHQKALLNRGQIVAAWASAETNDGTSHIYVMDYEELMKIRGSSPGYRPDDARNPYNLWPEEMFGKAPLKRLFKRLQVDSDTGRDVKDAVDAMGADMTARIEPDASPVFFEETPAPEEEPVVEAAPKKKTTKKEVVEQEPQPAQDLL